MQQLIFIATYIYRYGSSCIISISSLYIEEIAICFQCKCFNGQAVGLNGFRWKLKLYLMILNVEFNSYDFTDDYFTSFPL